MVIPTNITFDWHRLGSIGATKLHYARDEMHNAVQLVALMGKYLLPQREDDSQTSMQWYPQLQALVGEVIGDDKKFRAALRLIDHTLLVLSEAGEPISSYRLVDKTKLDGFHWLENQANQFGDYSPEMGIEMHYSIPGHPIQDGQPFSIDHEGEFEEMALYFSNAHSVFQALKDQIPQASAVRCWPHHFDLATLIKLDSHKTAEETRSIGIGFSPGDMSYSQPYFYVSPWPYPNIEELDLAPLKGNGKWHTEGWVGCLVLGEKFEKLNEEQSQKQMIADFILSALQACYEILENQESRHE